MRSLLGTTAPSAGGWSESPQKLLCWKEPFREVCFCLDWMIKQGRKSLLVVQRIRKGRGATWGPGHSFVVPMGTIIMKRNVGNCTGRKCTQLSHWSKFTLHDFHVQGIGDIELLKHRFSFRIFSSGEADMLDKWTCWLVYVIVKIVEL